MSRHEIPAKNPGHKVIVGWDPPLMTYFAQVIDRKMEDDDENDKFVMWIGCRLREIYEIEQLEQRIRPHAVLSNELKATLYGDKDEGR